MADLNPVAEAETSFRATVRAFIVDTATPEDVQAAEERYVRAKEAASEIHVARYGRDEGASRGEHKATAPR